MTRNIFTKNKKELFWAIIILAFLYIIKKYTQRLVDFAKGYEVTEEDKKELKEYKNTFNAKEYTLTTAPMIFELNLSAYHYSNTRKRYEISKGAKCWFPITDGWLNDVDRRLDNSSLGFISGYGSNEELLVETLTTFIYNEALVLEAAYNSEDYLPIDNPASSSACEIPNLTSICENLCLLVVVKFGIKQYFPHWGVGSLTGIPVNLNQYLRTEFTTEDIEPINNFWASKGMYIKF